MTVQISGKPSWLSLAAMLAGAMSIGLNQQLGDRLAVDEQRWEGIARFHPREDCVLCRIPLSRDEEAQLLTALAEIRRLRERDPANLSPAGSRGTSGTRRETIARKR